MKVNADAGYVDADSVGVLVWDDKIARQNVAPRCTDRHRIPGRIPGELIAHVLYFFTKPGDVIVDPMVGSGKVRRETFRKPVDNRSSFRDGPPGRYSFNFCRQ